ncbi:MAG: hypothetical protein ABR540_16330 [Acidimicrobiales bacterium]
MVGDHRRQAYRPGRGLGRGAGERTPGPPLALAGLAILACCVVKMLVLGTLALSVASVGVAVRTAAIALVGLALAAALVVFIGRRHRCPDACAALGAPRSSGELRQARRADDHERTRRFRVIALTPAACRSKGPSGEGSP